MATATPDERASRSGSDGSGNGTRSRFRTVSILALGLILSVHAFTGSFDALFAARNPVLALRVTGSPAAAVRAWQIAATRDPARISDSAIRNYATAAIAHEPLNAEALRALAFHEDALGKGDRAFELGSLSQAVTRRDELNQILLARIAARDDDIATAMDHLGTALTTSRRTREEVFALMIPLLSNPDFRQALAGEVTGSNEWIVAFLQSASRTRGVDPGDLAAVLLQAEPVAARGVAQAIGPGLLSAMAYSGDAPRAVELFERILPDRVALLADPSITPATSQSDLGLFGWTPLESAASGTEFGTTADGSFAALVFSAGVQERTPVLRRALRLPPANYILSDMRRDRTGSPAVDFDWSIQCRTARGWQPIGMETAANGWRFSIGPGCPIQLLELGTQSRRGGAAAEVVVENVSIRQSGDTGSM